MGFIEFPRPLFRIKEVSYIKNPELYPDCFCEFVSDFEYLM